MCGRSGTAWKQSASAADTAHSGNHPCRVLIVLVRKLTGYVARSNPRVGAVVAPKDHVDAAVVASAREATASRSAAEAARCVAADYAVYVHVLDAVDASGANSI